eukprot:2532093-Lingulodinium_polyedra.AAC.1
MGGAQVSSTFLGLGLGGEWGIAPSTFPGLGLGGGGGRVGHSFRLVLRRVGPGLGGAGWGAAVLYFPTYASNPTHKP